MTTPSKKQTSSTAVLQTLAWMRKQGFKPVPLHPHSKAAINRNYVEQGYKPPDDDFWKANDYGVGVVTGPVQGGPVDIDLDCQEAVYFARVFLPKTDAVFGRPGKQMSHYLYRVDAHAFEKRAFNDPSLEPGKELTVVEMRGDGGHQTVMPGSVHETTGELIEWSNLAFPEVATVDAAVLSLAVRKIALAVLCARHIWRPGYHNAPCKHLSGVFCHLEWPEEDAVQFIQALMDFTGDDDKSRIPTVRSTYKRHATGKKVSGAGVLRKELNDDRLVDRLLDWAGSQSANLMQEYNDRFAVVALGGKFRIADFDVPAGEPPVFYGKEDFLNVVGTDFIELDGKLKLKGNLWLSNPRRRTYKSVDFLPGQTDTDVLNLWTGWATEPKHGECEAWKELVEDIVCGGDAELFDWLCHWFANIVREPMEKSLTALVVVGVEGAGKSLMLNYFGQILGPAYVTVTKEEHIVGRFNSHMGSTLLLHSEEALYGGDKKHAGIIRSLITDPVHMFEQKGVDARKVRNYLRLVLTSNDMYAAPARPNDRRYTVIDMGDRKAPADLIQAVLYEMRHGGPAALHQELLDMTYTPAIPRTNVKNKSLLRLKSLNLTPVETWWLETLQTGLLLPDFLNWAQVPDKDDWPPCVSSQALHAAMSIKLRDRNIRMVPSQLMLSHQIEQFVGCSLVRAQRTYDNPMLDDYPAMVKQMNARQHSIINMPALDQCRAAFEKLMGQTFDWPEDDDTPKREKQRYEQF